MPFAPDITDLKLDAFACDLYLYTPRSCWPSFGVAPELLAVPFEPWEKANPALRETFRARAELFMTGDERLMPWRIRAGLA